MASDSIRVILNADRIIHEPARLAILSLLSMLDSADFKFLQSSLGLTHGNLSAHITKLEGAGFVSIEKGFIGKRVCTNLQLTKEGEDAFKAHLELLKGFLKLLET